MYRTFQRGKKHVSIRVVPHGYQVQLGQSAQGHQQRARRRRTGLVRR